MPRLIAGLILIIAILALVGCGDDDDATPTRGVDTTPAPEGTFPDDDPTTIETTPGPTANAAPGPPTGDRPLYLSVGDSLAAGIGATDPTRGGWAPLVALSLPDYDFVNLGIPGDDSDELLNDGQLDYALAEIFSREGDDDPANDVGVITLEIGGNDLLDIYFDLVIPGDCPNITESLQREVCVDAFETALSEYSANLSQTLTTLRSAVDAPIFLITLYNPFSGGASTVDEIGQLALEGMEGSPFPEGLNDVIRQIGGEFGVHMVEWYELFLGKQADYISMDLIHPNDTGHRVMADAVIGAMAQAGLPVVD
ncbi:MAG TPA: GDSL-type esterase/lipase family protein [Dehalococcoidia bacterium]|nr:GDSL-type esterase/lipase family protein [Dehalococcoidia bacterium]